ncbi:hypothetical protein Tco_1090062 [Tanacetum coccineum]|uniref:Uncharacterized protein n=1 Tax=Tanacetum coccineum TaxID=301880 RepID=A0ABQ5I4D7_9ASTR
MVRLWWLWWPQPARPPPQRWRQAAEHRETSRGVMPPQPDTTWGVSPAVAADAPPIATPRRRLRGHERGGLDDDGGVVTMACKAGDDGGSGWWRWRGGSVSSPEKQSAAAVEEREAPTGFADEVIYSLFAKQSEDLDLLHEDLEQIDDVDIEEMDIN